MNLSSENQRTRGAGLRQSHFGSGYDAGKARLQAEVEQLKEQIAAQTIRCGSSDHDPDVEQRYEALRQEQGKTTGPAGCCGEQLQMRFAYRCLECGRWAHAVCLSRHFRSAGNSQMMMIGGFAHAHESEGLGPWTGGITPVPARLDAADVPAASTTREEQG